MPSRDVTRWAIFALIQPTGSTGEGTGRWRLVTGAGVRFSYEGPVNSLDSISNSIAGLRGSRTPKVERESDCQADLLWLSLTARLALATVDHRDDVLAVQARPGQPVHHGRRQRDEIWELLRWLASKLDDNALKHQLVTHTQVHV
jgi:hypothetical protein